MVKFAYLFRKSVQKLLRQADDPTIRRLVLEGLVCYCVFITCMMLFSTFVLNMRLLRGFDEIKPQKIIEVGHINATELTLQDIQLMLKDAPKVAKTSRQQTCIFPPRSMEGRSMGIKDIPNSDSIEDLFPELQPGGRYVPPDCVPIARVAVIIPYRDRERHLKSLLVNIIPKLKRQKIDFTIYVTEQTHSCHFNRGMIRNIGFNEASKIADYDCYIFNDVDTVPEDDRNLYICNKRAIRHLVAAVDRYDYTLDYEYLIGGVLSFTKEQFIKVNGYSNQFFLWGGEDDDMYRRIKCANLKIHRPLSEIGVFTTLKHTNDPILTDRCLDVETGERVW